MGFFTNTELIKNSKVEVDIDQLVPNCTLCGLYKQCNSPKMEYSGEGRKKILVIGECPGKNEDDYGIQFIGDSGKFLKESLRELSISLNRDCWKINAVNCFISSENRTPTHKEIKACYPHVEKTIRKLKPQLILLFGGIAVTSLFGEDFSNRTISRWRAHRIPDQEFNCFIVPLFHPSYLIRNEKDENLHAIFKRDLKYAIATLKLSFNKQKDYEQYVTVLKDFRQVKQLLERIIQRKSKIVFDYETTGLKPYRIGHKIVTIGIGVSATKAFAFPFNYKSFWTAEELKEIKKLWKCILLDPKIKKIAQNAKFEESWSKVCIGARPNGLYYDTMIGSKILDNRSTATGLKFQTFVKFGVRPYDKFINPFLKSKNGEFNTIEQAPFKELLIYNGLDCIFSWMLYEQQKAKLSKMEGLSKAFSFFMRGTYTMGTIQYNGIHIDTKYYTEIKIKLTEQITKLSKYLINGREALKFKQQFGRPIKITSNQDLGKLFFEVLGKNPVYTESGKNYKTDKTTINSLNLPFADNLLEMKRLEKARGTYLNQFSREVYKDTIHPFFDLHIPVSYRGCIAGYEKVSVVRDFESYPKGIPIKDIRVGDMVWCFDNNLNLQLKKVLWQGKIGTKDIIRVHYYLKEGTGHFDCTPEHKIRLTNGMYIEAQYLLKGEKALASSIDATFHIKDKDTQKIEVLAATRNNQYKKPQPGSYTIIKIEELNRKEDVYDLMVEECHNFLVNKICVHNSSSMPNFQNLPARDAEIKKIVRKGIIPSPGCVLGEIDFAGSEVIASASYHKDKQFIHDITIGDMHRDLATELFMLPTNMLKKAKEKGGKYWKKGKKIRFFAKNNWTFAQFYGDWFGSCGALLWENVVEPNLMLPSGVKIKEHFESKGIYELGEITKQGPTEGSFFEHCKQVENRMWNERFPKYTQWKKDIIDFYQKYGYIETFFGFRFIGYMNNKQCVNYPIQSTSFHLLLYTLIKIENFIIKNKLKTKLIGQIHDSCVLDIPIGEIKFVINGVNKIVAGLQNKFPWLIVPMQIEIELSKLKENGGNFAEMEEYTIGQVNEKY